MAKDELDNMLKNPTLGKVRPWPSTISYHWLFEIAVLAKIDKH